LIRLIGAIVGGFVAWFIVATVGNVVFRQGWPGYAAVETSMAFSLSMMVGRILLGVISSLCGGAVAAWIAKGNSRAAMGLGIVLTLMFIPVHYALRDKFPLWYHLGFLASLLPATLVGARLTSRISRAAP
jgi:hypothetical protein